jgi:hypothetical protein
LSIRIKFHTQTHWFSTLLSINFTCFIAITAEDLKCDFLERDSTLTSTLKKYQYFFLKILNITRCVTKIKTCSGFMRVHRILKVWSLLSSKIIISSKYRGISRTQRSSTKNFFQSKNLLKIWSFFESLHYILSEK